MSVGSLCMEPWSRCALLAGLPWALLRAVVRAAGATGPGAAACRGPEPSLTGLEPSPRAALEWGQGGQGAVRGAGIATFISYQVGPVIKKSNFIKKVDLNPSNWPAQAKK